MGRPDNVLPPCLRPLSSHIVISLFVEVARLVIGHEFSVYSKINQPK